ncbi:phosphagen kinase [Sulfurimonas sp.]
MSLEKYPESLKGSNSLLAKYLTQEVFDKLKDKKTAHGFTLAQAINSGVQNPDSSIGAYVGDEESYEVFALLFDPIIEEYHGFTKSDKHKSNLNPDDLNAPNPDPKGEYILSTRIRVGRNVKDLPLGPAISKEQRSKVEKDVSSVLNSFEGNLAGKYYPLNNLKDEERASLIADHFLFKAGDRFLEAAGLNRDWPSGRGIFHNNEKTFLVWINEEDELRIISMQQGGDIKEVFTRLTTAVAKISKKVEFAYNEHLGYITSCPTNLGTAMRASVHIKLPNLGAKMEEFQAIADKHNVQIRGIHGEHSDSEGGIYDISNKRRLGVTEVECVQDMYDGVVALIKREKELEK